MPVRTSAVVAVGLVSLAIIGVTTIFGDFLLAVVAPPPVDGVAAAANTARVANGTPAPPGANAVGARANPAAPAPGGPTNNPDGNP